MSEFTCTREPLTPSIALLRVTNIGSTIAYIIGGKGHGHDYYGDKSTGSPVRQLPRTSTSYRKYALSYVQESEVRSPRRIHSHRSLAPKQP